MASIGRLDTTTSIALLSDHRSLPMTISAAVSRVVSIISSVPRSASVLTAPAENAGAIAIMNTNSVIAMTVNIL